MARPPWGNFPFILYSGSGPQRIITQINKVDFYCTHILQVKIGRKTTKIRCICKLKFLVKFEIFTYVSFKKFSHEKHKFWIAVRPRCFFVLHTKILQATQKGTFLYFCLPLKKEKQKVSFTPSQSIF